MIYIDLIMNKTTSFSHHWLSDPEFSGWIGTVPDDKHRARCIACGCTFDLSNMGKRALQSHATGKKHQKALALMVTVKKEQNTLHSFFPKVPKAIPIHDTALAQEEIPGAVPPDLHVPPPPPLTVQQSAASTTNGSKQQCVLKISSGDVLRAEVLWSIKVVLSHFSVNSCTGMPELFRSMFPDSSIAKEFKISKTKCSYIIRFGLAPYFKELLMKKLKEADCKFVISFDESLNRILQEEQMDLIIHFWDKERQKVSMLYYGSKFLGHTTSKDLVSNFREALGALSMSNLVQIGMDGPRTNWKFFEDFVKERDPDLPGLINLGSCSLHVVHGAFKTGAQATGWDLAGILRALWYLFHESPARREDYTAFTGSILFPLQFCATRWLEDIAVAERAVVIWTNIQKYINKILTKPKAQIPKNNSFKVVQGAVKDPLTIPKLQVFIMVSRVLKPYLQLFQRIDPMIPFMADELFKMTKAVMAKFVKKEVVEKASTPLKLAHVDLSKSDNLFPPNKVVIGFAAKAAVDDMESKKQLSARDVLQFQSECLSFMKELTAKLQQRSPLKYPIVRYLVSLDPRYMATKPSAAAEQFEKLLQKLYELRLQTAENCDIILQQYKQFVDEVQKYHKEQFLGFRIAEDPLDSLLYSHVGDAKPQYAALWDTIKMLLILSHGQSGVERGFSQNKDIMGTNMQHETLVSYRLVYDGLQHLDVPVTDCVNPEMLNHCKHAHSRYKLHLDDQKKAAAETTRATKRKAVQDDLDTERKKKTSLEKCVSNLEQEADALASEAERKNKMALLVKSNAYRVKAKEKKTGIDDTNSKIKELQCTLSKIWILNLILWMGMITV